MDYIDEIIKYSASKETAIVFGAAEISYEKLYADASGFAAYLLEKKLGSVIIKTARSANAVTAALGAIFSGGVFAFLGSNTPQETLDCAKRDLGAQLIVGDDIDFSAYPPAPASFTPVPREPSAPVCAVFTSGSTGRPKGALLTYRALCETVKWQTGYMKLPEKTHTGSYAEFGFIASFWELWYPLANGFTLHIAEQNTRLDMGLLSQFIDENNLSYIFLPSDVAELFTSIYSGGALRFLRVAGGRLGSCGQPRGYEILYSLGMAENSGSVTFYPINRAMSGDVPIGKAFGDTEIYLIDGEMCVSGPCLFAGYAGRSELTAKALIPNPNAKGRPEYEKMYLSGDLAQLASDGNLLYKGRRDWIIKIGNIKTNPLESERVIRETSGVAEAAVVPFYRADKSAYLTCFYSGQVEPDALELLLEGKLPPNAIPSYFIRLVSLPKNANGKIDRTKLKMPESNQKSAELSSEKEALIAAAFEKILDLPSGSVGSDDGFIRLGGSSLALMRLQTELIKSTGLELRYSDLFAAQTPRAIALLRAEKEAVIARTAPKLNTPYPLTAPERQMWLLWRSGQDKGRYTLRLRCDFDGVFLRAKAQAALAALTQKHPALCSYYTETDGVPFRYFSDEKISLSDKEVSLFDLKKGPLFAAALLESSLIFTAHHIIADAAAMRVLAEDFWALYLGEPTEDAAALHELELYEASQDFAEDSAYWQHELAGRTFPALPIELDSAATKEHIVSFTVDETEALKKYAADSNVTLFILFTAAAAKLTALLTQSDFACVGVPVSGRDLPETIRTVGMLVRTLPLAVDTQAADLVRAVNEKFQNAAAHRSYPFELMNERFGARYDVMVNYLPLPQKLKDASGLHPRLIRGGYPAPAAKLVIDLREELSGGVSAVFTYDSYKSETIESWSAAFRAILLRESVRELIIPAKAAAEAADAPPLHPEFAEVLAEFFGTTSGSFYELGGTSLMAIQIEEALLLRGFYISAADILRVQNFGEISKLIIAADEIDWEAQ
ncbi:MAG: AMP-binding protein [Oscillospiraceae bacterium]|jgi:non-ribosomal peptide synthetase component F|nr:AMP-binding protein [Oscillospiraceae bacterium]